MLKLNWPSTVKLTITSTSLVSDTTGEQAGSQEAIDEDPAHWKLISETDDHEEIVIDRLVDFAEYAIETTDFINESIAKEIEDNAEKANAWKKKRATWLKEQGQELEAKGKGHGRKQEDEFGWKTQKTKGKGKGKGKTWTEKEEADMEVDEEVSPGGWGKWPEDAEPKNTSGASGSGRKTSGKGKGKQKSTCVHCGKWGSHKPEDCWKNPASTNTSNKKGKGKGSYNV
jgi:hypothetical protein